MLLQSVTVVILLEKEKLLEKQKKGKKNATSWKCGNTTKSFPVRPTIS